MNSVQFYWATSLPSKATPMRFQTNLVFLPIVYSTFLDGQLTLDNGFDITIHFVSSCPKVQS